MHIREVLNCEPHPQVSKILFFRVYDYVPHEYLVPDEGQRVPDNLELELQMVVNHYMGAGIQTLVLKKNSKCS